MTAYKPTREDENATDSVEEKNENVKKNADWALVSLIHKSNRNLSM